MKIVVKLILGFLAATLITVYVNAVAPLSAFLVLSDVVGVMRSIAGDFVNREMKIDITSKEWLEKIKYLKTRDAQAIYEIEKTSTTEKEKVILEKLKKARADFLNAFDRELEALARGNHDAALNIYKNEVFQLSENYSGYVLEMGNLKIELARNTF